MPLLIASHYSSSSQVCSATHYWTVCHLAQSQTGNLHRCSKHIKSIYQLENPNPESRFHTQDPKHWSVLTWIGPAAFYWDSTRKGSVVLSAVLNPPQLLLSLTNRSPHPPSTSLLQSRSPFHMHNMRGGDWGVGIKELNSWERRLLVDHSNIALAEIRCIWAWWAMLSGPMIDQVPWLISFTEL